MQDNTHFETSEDERRTDIFSTILPLFRLNTDVRCENGSGSRESGAHTIPPKMLKRRPPTSAIEEA